MTSAGRVFCFDLDDTLVSEWDYVESGLRAAGAILDAEVATTEGAESAESRLVRLWRDERGPDTFQRLLAERGLDAEAWLPRLKRAYREHSPQLTPRAGAVELLDALTVSGCSLALVSDGYLEVQQRKWAALRLPHRFDPVVFADEKGCEYWKPHPWAFEQVMRAYPGATRFIYVGDNPAKDFIAPNLLGWMTVMVRDERNVHPSTFEEGGPAAPQRVVESLAEVAEFA